MENQRINKVFFKIIISNYNSIAYIKQCLDSILCQTFNDYFIIIIDDMSTDLSDKICEMYERKHTNKIKFIRVKEKSLAGKCRNIGIDYPIDSQYTLFVDADDMLNGNNALQIMYKNLIDFPDVLIYNYSVLYQSSQQKHNLSNSVFNAKSNNLANTKYNSAWSKAIRSNKVKRFLEGCMRGEDTYMWLQVLDENPTIKQINDHLYVYRMHNSNIIKSSQFQNDNRTYKMALQNLKSKMKNKYVISSIERRLT